MRWIPHSDAEDGQGRTAEPAGPACDLAANGGNGGGSDWELGIPPETLFEEAPCFITVQDSDLNILHANRQFREVFGYHPGDTCFQLFKQRGTPCPDCIVLETFADGKSHKSEENFTTQDGRKMTVIVQTTPLKDDAGNITAVMEMATDITEAKNLQRKLDHSRKLLRTLVDEVPCYITVQDRDFRLVEVNQRFRDDFGYHFGAHCYEVYKHRTEPCLRCPVAETFNDGQMHTSEEVVFTLGGVKRNVLVQTAPLRGASGEIDTVLEISTDITEIRQLQDQLTSLGLLVGSVSHGIKGLLTGLDGGVYVLNSGFERNDVDRIKQGWDMIQRNVNRVRSMVLDLLYYAKDREPVYAPIDPVALMGDACAIQAKKAKGLGVNLVQVGDPDPRPFEGDPGSLHTLLTNLLENSLDACRLDSGKQAHEVRITYRGDDENIHFEVTDNGIGMDQETREKAFCLFFSSKGTEGTGLGLFIANKIAVKHGGGIRIDSESGQGTTFRVVLPRGHSNLNQTLPPRQASPLASQAQQNREGLE